ncbi:hypothetical protein ACJX0J_006568, partial [Zea mays]
MRWLHNLYCHILLLIFFLFSLNIDSQPQLSAYDALQAQLAITRFKKGEINIFSVASKKKRCIFAYFEPYFYLSRINNLFICTKEKWLVNPAHSTRVFYKLTLNLPFGIVIHYPDIDDDAAIHFYGLSGVVQDSGDFIFLYDKHIYEDIITKKIIIAETWAMGHAVFS